MSFILGTCNSEKKEIRGTWINQKEQSSTFFLFYKDGSYKSLIYNNVSTEGKDVMIFQDGSIGYYNHVGYHKYDLYEVDVDLSPILGKSVMDATIGKYLDKYLKDHPKPDLNSAKPSFIAQIQNDGEHLYILQNEEIIIKLKMRHINFGDKR